MAFTNAKWDGSASGYKDTNDYCDACLIDLNPAGKDKVQALCKLPVKTPDGDYNTNAMSSAAGVLSGGMGGLKDVPAEAKAKAISKLRSLYSQNGVKRADMPKALQ
jgi:hypothetical protein